MLRYARRTPVLFSLIVLACSLLGGLYGAAAAAEDDVRASVRAFARVYELVESNAADRPDPDKAVYKGAIPGMLRSLDPHSSFFDPRDFKLLREEQHGQYFGVGMLIGQQSGKVLVIHPFSGSPAYKAGIRPGDVVVTVDGKPTGPMTLTEVVDHLKGPRGTRVHVGIAREAIEKPLEFDLVRDAIARKSVTQAFFLRPRVAYLRIESFNENTSRELEQALRRLPEREVGELILDLRNNPGGLLNEGVAVAERFLKKGQAIVSHRGRVSPERVYYSGRGPQAPDYPIVVLVNRFSASAAEIVAGALQDHDRAWILGESTFGKGLVQSQYPLSEDTALLLTTARYYTPSGRLIQRDWANASFFEYYYHKDTTARNPKDIKTTDGGRTVYGGGGITPDESYSPARLERAQARLLSRAAFFNFTASYFATHEAKLPRGWKPDAPVLAAFREFLRAKQIALTDEEFTANREFIERQLRIEMYTTAFSKEDADRLAVEIDPAIERAIQALPKSKALIEKTNHASARRRP